MSDAVREPTAEERIEHLERMLDETERSSHYWHDKCMEYERTIVELAVIATRTMSDG